MARDLLDKLRRAATSRAADEGARRAGLPVNPLTVAQAVRDIPADLKGQYDLWDHFFKPPDNRDAAQILQSELMKFDPTGRLKGLPSQKPEDLGLPSSLQAGLNPMESIRSTFGKLNPFGQPPEQFNEMERFYIEMMREQLKPDGPEGYSGEEFVRNYIDMFGGTSTLPMSKEKLLQELGLKPLTIYEEVFGLEEEPFTPSNGGPREPANYDTMPGKVQDIMKVDPDGWRRIQQRSPGINLENVDFLNPSFAIQRYPISQAPPIDPANPRLNTYAAGPSVRPQISNPTYNQPATRTYSSSKAPPPAPKKDRGQSLLATLGRSKNRRRGSFG